MRERRVDVQRLAGLLHLLLPPPVLGRAHVVEPVRELDQDDPRVVGHRHDHLPVVLGLGLLAGLEADPGQLGDALDEVRDVRAELLPNLVDRRARVLHDVVEERRRDGLLVEVKLCADLRDSERMLDELLTGAARLPLVGVRSEAECPCQKVAIRVLDVRLDVPDQLVDEILVTLR